jgi:hypothetical protein
MPDHHELTMSHPTATHSQIKISWLIGIAAAFALFAVIGAYSARMTRDYSDYDQDRANQRYQTLATLQAAEGKLLNPVDEKGKPSAVWVDQDKGIISIPIEEAMAKEVDDLKAKPVAAGVEINPPAPAAAPSATTPATPAPSAGSTNAAPATPSPAIQPSVSGAKASTGAGAKTTPPPAKPKT